MVHHHEHPPAAYDRAFALGIALNVLIIIIQIGLGFMANSLALLADASHNLSDVLGLAFAWGAAALGRRLPTSQRTYGWRRSSIFAALANALLLVLATGAITWEAIHRLGNPSPVAGGVVVWAAGIAAIVNAGAALLFLKGRTTDLNLRAAFLHLAADAAVSVGVAVAGLAILATGWLWLDPVVSLGIGAIILLTTWEVLRDACNLALDAVPAGVDIREVRAYLAGLPEVVGVHDLHVWGMSTTEIALTVHLAMRSDHLNDALLTRVSDELHDHFGIEHATIQLEAQDGQHSCPLGPETVAQAARPAHHHG